jgi:hypothetical protein
VYNGFYWTRPTDGARCYFTIQKRTFNRRPYAVYIDGSESASMNTYINRGACANALKKLQSEIQKNCPDYTFTDIIGPEIIR